MNKAQEFMDYSCRLIQTIAEQERKSIEKAADAVRKTMESGGMLYTYGTGHSTMLCMEPFERAGGLGACYPILDERLMPHTVKKPEERFLERDLGVTEEIFKRPLFVTDYPKEIKAFYMRMNDDGKTVAAADCLVPGIGEIIGGSQREERLDVLTGRIKELGMREEDYWWYLDLRRYGSCRHAGFGLGFERIVMYLTGVNNIRDVELHPRTVGNAEF